MAHCLIWRHAHTNTILHRIAIPVRFWHWGAGLRSQPKQVTGDKLVSTLHEKDLNTGLTKSLLQTKGESCYCSFAVVIPTPCLLYVRLSYPWWVVSTCDSCCSLLKQFVFSWFFTQWHFKYFFFPLSVYFWAVLLQEIVSSFEHVSSWSADGLTSVIL